MLRKNVGPLDDEINIDTDGTFKADPNSAVPAVGVIRALDRIDRFRIYNLGRGEPVERGCGIRRAAIGPDGFIAEIVGKNENDVGPARHRGWEIGDLRDRIYSRAERDRCNNQRGEAADKRIVQLSHYVDLECWETSDSASNEFI